MSANSLCLQILYSSFARLCYDDCVQADPVFSWRPDAGVLEVGRGQSRRKRRGDRTRALWRQDAGRVDARRGRSGGRTRADAGLSYFLAVLYIISK